jgi:NAD(P)H-dependent flavin oxidoreductase YrpB (nitropropane dioxygenase family)
MLRTKICELLEIEAPVLGAPMGPEITGLELAAAVSNAGGLGIISFGSPRRLVHSCHNGNEHDIIAHQKRPNFRQ